MTAIRKPMNHDARMKREAAAKVIFDRNIRKEREIGVHPKFLNSYRRAWALSPAEREKASKAWDKKNGVGAGK